MRGVFETTKQLLSSWSIRGQFAPTHSYQLPQCVRETKGHRIGRPPWTPPSLYDGYHFVGPEVMKWLEAGQNLVLGKRRVMGRSAISSPRR